jgi:ABC-type nitrate/sulfonate/bicarbonate transport system substrate-binding protein
MYKINICVLKIKTRRHFMLKRRILCALVAATLMLSACGKKEATEEYVSHGENIVNGNTSLIVDETEGQKAPLTRPPEDARMTLTVGVVKNDPSAITFAGLAAENESDEAFEKYTFKVAENYTELAEMLKSGEVGVAVLPPVKALDMYATDKSVKLLASVSQESYRLVGEGISSLSDLSGKTIYIPQEDKTYLCVMKNLLSYAGIKDCTIDYVQNNEELYSKVKSGEIKNALMTEPYISMLKQEGNAVATYDFTYEWITASEGSAYCSGSVVATNEYITKQKAVIDYMLEDMNRSAEAIKTDAATSAENAVKYGFADNAKAVEDAYANIDCTFLTGKGMRYFINSMLTFIENEDDEVLGTDVPDEEFYLVKD